ncbi:uncharacterized protein LOC124894810, partial [Capsicum annuum]|uniref:uncharacterized protein LOC124894810 n=1 Tax=Capsicum annuum TaxID=4072 RepID=UPI001FB07585
AEGFKFVLVEECPVKLDEPTDDEIKAYDKWVKADEMTAIKALLTTKMVEGTSVREYVLKMLSLLNELEILGAVIDKESQVEMVLQILPDSFQQLRLNYNINKINLSLAKLLNELQAKESIIK